MKKLLLFGFLFVSVLASAQGDGNFKRVKADTVTSKSVKTNLIQPYLVSDKDYSIIVVPDIQNNIHDLPAQSRAIFNWIVAHKVDWNIKVVIGLGDITNNNTVAEMDTASQQFALLDAAGIPYLAIVGNHDYGFGFNPAGRDATNFNNFFGPSRYTTSTWYKGHMPGTGNENFFITFEAEKRKFMAIGLEFLPRDTALNWAARIIDSVYAVEPDRDVIISTHAYQSWTGELARDTTVYSTATYGMSADNDGQEMWDKLIKKKPSIKYVFNGHYIVFDYFNGVQQPSPAKGLAAHIQATGENGNMVNQLYANYQDDSLGGRGEMMRMRFHPNRNKVDVDFYAAAIDHIDAREGTTPFTIDDQALVVKNSESSDLITAQGDVRTTSRFRSEQLQNKQVVFVGTDHSLYGSDNFTYYLKEDHGIKAGLYVLPKITSDSFNIHLKAEWDSTGYAVWRGTRRSPTAINVIMNYDTLSTDAPGAIFVNQAWSHYKNSPMAITIDTRRQYTLDSNTNRDLSTCETCPAGTFYTYNEVFLDNNTTLTSTGVLGEATYISRQQIRGGTSTTNRAHTTSFKMGGYISQLFVVGNVDTLGQYIGYKDAITAYSQGNAVKSYSSFYTDAGYSNQIRSWGFISVNPIQRNYFSGQTMIGDSTVNNSGSSKLFVDGGVRFRNLPTGVKARVLMIDSNNDVYSADTTGLFGGGGSGGGTTTYEQAIDNGNTLSADKTIIVGSHNHQFSGSTGQLSTSFTNAGLTGSFTSNNISNQMFNSDGTNSTTISTAYNVAKLEATDGTDYGALFVYKDTIITAQSILPYDDNLIDLGSLARQYQYVYPGGIKLGAGAMIFTSISGHIQTATSATNDITFDAYHTGALAYTTFITLTAGNPATANINGITKWNSHSILLNGDLSFNANFTLSGGHATTFSTTGTTGVTLPTGGTLATRAGTETFTNKDLSSGTNTFPTFNQNTTGSAGSVANALSISAELISGGASSYNGSAAKSITIQSTSVTNTMLAGSIAASKLIGTDIATVGTITSGTWNGTAIGDIYISSATTWNSKAASGANTDITSILLNQTGLVVRGASANALIIKPNETLSADRTLNIIVNNASRTIDLSGNLTVTGTASLVGTNTGDQTSVSGNAGTATILQTTRNIQGVPFNGSADINIINGTGFVKSSGTTLSYDNSTYWNVAGTAGGLSVSGGLNANDVLLIRGTAASASNTATNTAITFIVGNGAGTAAQIMTHNGNTSFNNHVITDATLNSTNIIQDVAVTIGSDADYDVWYRGTSGKLTRLGSGTDGKALTTHSSSSAPTWESYQPLDGDLTTIAGLAATTDNFIVSVSSAWASRTPTQVKTTLSLNNVENTALSTWAGSTNITTLGTIATGTWNGTLINQAYLGTGGGGSSKFLREDNTWQTIAAGGDMILASVQSVTGKKTFDKDKFAMKGTSTGVTTWSTANTSGTDYNFQTPAVDITAAQLTDLTTSTSAATASVLVKRDASANIYANNWLGGYTTTATAAGTTTLTIASTFLQYFTGATTQTVTLPVVSTLPLGTQYTVVNLSTGAVTVQSSGSNTVITVAGSTSAVLTSTATSGTDQTVWSASYSAANVASGKKLTVSNTITLAGTDATTMTFPTTNASIARTDAAQVFTGQQTANILAPANTTTLSAIEFTPSGALLETASEQGDLEVNSGGIMYYSTAAAERGVVGSEQFVAITSANTLTSQTAVQPIFDGGGGPANGRITLASSRSYFFEMDIDITAMSSTSGTFSLAFGGTATLTSIRYRPMAQKSSQGTINTVNDVIVTSAASTPVVGANTTVAGRVYVTGIIRVNAGGTLIPQIAFSTVAGPATPVITADSWIRLRCIGTNTIASIGNWD